MHIHRHALLSFVFLAMASTFSSSSAAPSIKWKYVRVPEELVTKEFVKDTDFIRDHKWDDTFAIGYIRADRAKRINEATKESIVELNAIDWSENEYDVKTLLPVQRASRTAFGPYEEYHTYTSLTAELKILAEKYPNLVTLVSAGKSVEGRDLWYVKVTAKGTGDEDRPKLLYVSSMHGDEVVGKELMMYFIRELVTRYGTDERITRLVSNAQLFIMPSMNPDGTERHQRFNANGVDLNRDFPDLDEEPFSVSNRAIETKALMELHRQHQFLIATNFHTGAVCINIPWDSHPNGPGQMFGDDALMMMMAREYADSNQPMHDVHFDSFDHGVTYGYEWYQVLGGMQDWAVYFRQAIHSTVELSDVKWPSASSLPAAWENNRNSLYTYFEHGIFGIHLKAVDEQGNVVKNVSVDISSAKRTVNYDGYVHRPTIPGVQQVTLKAPGFATQTISVNPLNFDGTYQTVVLSKVRL